MSTLGLFAAYACDKGYKAIFTDGFVTISDVLFPGNNFRLSKKDDQYIVSTISISNMDHEYAAKCQVYLLIAKYNKDNPGAAQEHLNFKVEL